LATLFADPNAWCETMMTELDEFGAMAWPQAESLASA